MPPTQFGWKNEMFRGFCFFFPQKKSFCLCGLSALAGGWLVERLVVVVVVVDLCLLSVFVVLWIIYTSVFKGNCNE